MELKFTKMHGLGNDFVVIDAVSQAVDLSGDQYRYLADRRLGIGCDQILLVEVAQSDAADFRYRIFNADGGEVEQCGNGARCFAKFVRDQGLTNKDSILVETKSGLITLNVHNNGEITVDMGPARLEPAQIPFQADTMADHYNLDTGGDSIDIGAVSIGNPHAVMRVDDIDTAPVATLGPQIENHPRFPNRVNAGFMQIIDRSHIRLRVWERGVGETQACGTGACAAVVSGILRGWLDNQVTVDLQGGQLVIQWSLQSGPVLMTGAAQSVFEGTIQL